MPILDVSREKLILAMTEFDETLRETPSWEGWEQKQNHRYAIVQNGKLYPVKQVISMATGTPKSQFLGGYKEALPYIEKHDLTWKPLREKELLVAGSFPTVDDDDIEKFARLIEKTGFAASWWSWRVNFERDQLLRDGFIFLVYRNRKFVYYYRVPPDGFVDRGPTGGSECPWPKKHAPSRYRDRFWESKRSRVPHCWLKLVDVGRIVPPLTCADLSSANGNTEVKLFQNGFTYAYLNDPAKLNLVSFLNKETKEAAMPMDISENPFIQRARALLKEKGQIVFYGPPGTGKTWYARELVRMPSIQTEMRADRRFFLMVANPAGEHGWHWDQIKPAGFVEYDGTGQFQSAFDAAQPGDLVFGYLAGPAHRQLYTAVAVDGSVDRKKPAEEQKLRLKAIPGLARFPTAISLADLKSDDLLSQSVPIRTGMRGSIFPLSSEQAERIVDLLTQTPANRSIAERLRKDFLYESDSPKTRIERTRTVTFHPAYAYEDFVEGIRPVLADAVIAAETHGASSIRYELRPGIFRDLCEEAHRFPNDAFYLLIDEINRGNIPSIFGELITLLEKDKRRTKEQEAADSCVVLPYSRMRFSVPPNVYLVGTMNTADRSIALLDLALRRRFAFIEVPPEPELISNPGSLDGKQAPPIKEILPLLQRAAGLLRALNGAIAALKDPDHCIGHSFFLPLRQTSDEAGFKQRFRDLFTVEVAPLLAEYFYNDWERIARLLPPAKFLRKQAALPKGMIAGQAHSEWLGFKAPHEVDSGAFDALCAHFGVDVPAPLPVGG